MNRGIEKYGDRMIALANGPSYSSDAPSAIAKEFRILRTVFSLGVGVKLWVFHFRGIPVRVCPSREMRGEAILRGGDSTCIRMFHGLPYHFDPCGSLKITEAIERILNAFLTTDSPRDAARALGAAGRCCCCGADLTDPVSVSRGIGPECIKKIWASYLLLSKYEDLAEMAGIAA